MQSNTVCDAIYDSLTKGVPVVIKKRMNKEQLFKELGILVDELEKEKRKVNDVG